MNIMISIQIILVLLTAISITMNEAQQRGWGQGRWGRLNSFDSSNMLDDDPMPSDQELAFLKMIEKLTNGNNFKEQPASRQPEQQQRLTTQSSPATESSMNQDPANAGTVIFMSPCPRCGVTQQYNPVCGSDNRTYANKRVLDCHRLCGLNVTLKRLGGCGANRS
ncbi:hypothetical protein LSTR_LSTR002905 [Laodelphax striatellus]|uniref:Kazal-like domain-containing protein n=1 Tax=Laodelphax striatellus TaxID=195883 RepID=A0A482XL78_LAOST|nr:hypothetical protein LSTR_LSTR002905 [Laodelphax striatellus]